MKKKDMYGKQISGLILLNNKYSETTKDEKISLRYISQIVDKFKTKKYKKTSN